MPTDYTSRHQGTGGAVPVVNCDWYPDMASAVAAVPPGGTLLLGNGPYASSHPTLAAPIQKSIKIVGLGMPAVNSTGNGYVAGTGTIITGPLFIDSNNVSVSELGIDVSAGGEGLSLGDGAAEITNIEVDNVKVVGSDRNSNFHGIFLAGVNGFSIGYIEAHNIGAGVVIKARNGTIGRVKAVSCQKYGILFKSEAAQPANNCILGEFISRDGGGLRFESSTAGINDIAVGTINVEDCGFGVERFAAPGLPILRCNVNGGIVTNVPANVPAVVSVGTGPVSNCHDRLELADPGLGYTFGTNTNDCSFTGSVVGSTHYSVDNYGARNVLRSLISRDPASGHVRNHANALIIIGGMETEGTSNRVAILGGSVVNTRYMSSQSAPPATPVAGGEIFVSATGQLCYIGPSGTLTIVAPA
jgi:hypothetical protein